jgi:peptidoglycan/xylan/chitin deacetylase (PgdA/CDA1 family)
LKRYCLLLALAVALTGSLWGEVRFSGLDLSRDGELLFQIRASGPSCGPYDTLFLENLGSGKLRQLTLFPEQVMSLPSSGGLLVYNRYGLFASDEDLGALRPLAAFSSFLGEQRIERGELPPVALSPDGRCLLYVRPTSAAFGDLLLIDVAAETEYLVSRGVEVELGNSPALWASDSSFFVYSKGNTLYYQSARQSQERRPLTEGYREIGPGKLSNLSVGADGLLYYVAGTAVYRLDSRELFTRAFYRGYLDIGRLVGQIPFRFDGNFDRFWVSPQGSQILLNKGRRNLFLYVLSAEDFADTGGSRTLPYLYLPRNTRVSRVLWPAGGPLTVLTEVVEAGTRKLGLYRLEPGERGVAAGFAALEAGGLRDVALSPDGGRAALLFSDRVLVYDYPGWNKQAERAHREPLRAVWLKEGELLIAGRWITECWQPGSGQSRELWYSQAEAFSFSADEQELLLQTGGTVLARQMAALHEETPEAEAGILRPADLIRSPQGPFRPLREKRVSSDAYRVFLEDSPRSAFANAIMVRDIAAVLTRPLVDREPAELEAFPSREEPPDPLVFAHGSRLRRREVALVFNVIQSVEGLAETLATLSAYGLRATFFVNGEAIRSHPDAVREIGASGHEVGSLFSVAFNMTDTRFRLDREFIKAGLARNEDEYFEATGREISLLWHAPYYFVSSEILTASGQMNYQYVSRDVDSLDWVTRDVAATTQDIYYGAAQLVERIMARKKPGSIVPVTIGSPDNGRDDYLFQKLDLLIDALLAAGYELVPVSVLMEHAR